MIFLKIGRQKGIKGMQDDCQVYELKNWEEKAVTFT